MATKPRLSCARGYGSDLGLGNSSLPCRSEAANGGCRHLRIVNDWILCVVRILEGHIWCLGEVLTMPFLSNGHAQWFRILRFSASRQAIGFRLMLLRNPWL
jgi:hypothetical protein